MFKRSEKFLLILIFFLFNSIMIMIKMKILLYLKIKNLFDLKTTFLIRLKIINLFYRVKDDPQILFLIYNYLFFRNSIFYLIMKKKNLKIKN